ncbi:DUF58 domain-containing protein [Arthrobacter sp. N1]|uniref:DUF58 domain-containing protein n=1 Tax=Arthrobacter sp. N1 TaxID=619291 RepID=UPI003BAEB85D
MADTPGGHSPGSALAVILALVCVVSGLVSGRPDTVALGAPLALLALAGRRAQVRRTVHPSFSLDRRGQQQGGRLRLLLAPPGTDSGTPRTSLVAAVLAAPGCAPDVLVLREGEECPVLADGPLSGEVEILSYGTLGLSPDLTHASAFHPAPPVRVSILPPIGSLLARPVSRRLVGLAGTHGSRRPGEGAELRTIAPLEPGDQLRRIDWRSTARRSTDQDRLMVRRSFADAEASVLLVIDQGHDLPASTSDWFAAGSPRLVTGSLHGARTAAATIAASYLAAGDRVGLDDLGGTRRALRTASGARHLEQIRARLAATGVVPRRRRRRDPVPPQGAVVVVLSAFLDPEPGRLLKLWHARGHVVIGVDCVPVLERTEATPAQERSVRLTLLRRRLLLEDLRRDGIAVVDGSVVEGLLADRDRMAARPAASGTTAPSGRDRPARQADLAVGPDLSLPTGFRLLARRGRPPGVRP